MEQKRIENKVGCQMKSILSKESISDIGKSNREKNTKNTEVIKREKEGMKMAFRQF